MKPMVSLEMSDEEKLDQILPIPMPGRPDYPPGTRISLNQRELIKLGIDTSDLCSGGIIHFHALARIVNVSRDDGENGVSCRVEMQIEDMCCAESEDAENKEAERKMSNPLYDRT